MGGDQNKNKKTRSVEVLPVLAGAYLFWVLPFSPDPMSRCMIGAVAVLVGAGLVDDGVAVVRGRVRAGDAGVQLSIVNAPVRVAALCLGTHSQMSSLQRLCTVDVLGHWVLRMCGRWCV